MGGKRKFRLTCRKNWEKRKYARRKKTHSQQRSAIPLDSTRQQSGVHPPPVQPPPAAQPSRSQPTQRQPDAQPPPAAQPSRSQPTQQQPDSQPPPAAQPSRSQPTQQQPDSQPPPAAQPSRSQPTQQQPDSQPPPAAQPSRSQPTQQGPTTTRHEQLPTSQLHKLWEELQCMELGEWCLLPLQTDKLHICLHSHTKSQPAVISTLQVSPSLKWDIYVHAVRIEASSIPMLSFLPTTIKTAVDVNTILTGVNKCTVCPGNDYEQFAEVFGARNGTLRDSHGTIIAFYEESTNCIRHVKCQQLFTPETNRTKRCPVCTLQLTGGEEALEMAQFISLVDKFFDCVNVTSLMKGKLKRKVFQNPYRSGKDFRLKFLKDEFIEYLERWRKSVAARPGFNDEERKRMMLSQETLTGLKITVSSFVELVPELFKIRGVKLFLSDRINQDPLEKHFGRLRQQGRTNQNPTVADTLKNTQTLRVVDTVWLDDITGNCRGRRKRKFISVDDNQTLPKRKRQRRPSV